ncbi:MAG: hypothetical protein B0W54_09245 [Cellvibrio sp. 79]|nr:MAG: hypothetical protein B0W54_09245 [Cellvibrio sp. 79]
MASTLLQLAKYGHQLDGILNRYKAALYPQRFMDYHRWLKQQSTAIPDNHPLVVFDFRDSRIDGPQGRRFYCLFIFFIRAGFYPVLRENYFFLGNIQDKYKKLCLQEKFSVLHQTQSLPEHYVLVTDKWYSRLARTATQIISLNYQTDYSPDSQCFPMPFPMFPPVYAHQQDLQLASYRQQVRPWNIFFGGDAEPDKYNKNSIRDIYAKLSRAHVLDTLRNNLTHNTYRELNNNADLDKALQENIRGLVIMNTRQCKVAPINWLGTLANSNFFLACPGVRYPMSHNLIEALAVGSIPITQYPEMFFPALEDGKNCLVFSSETELLEKVQQAMAMPAEQLSSMRYAAQNYYDTYLKPGACIKQLLNHHPHKISLRLLPFLKAGGGFA